MASMALVFSSFIIPASHTRSTSAQVFAADDLTTLEGTPRISQVQIEQKTENAGDDEERKRSDCPRLIKSGEI